ncbi:MAG: type I 3-dehydroquinate dehydratase [Methanotrichaceae archaeon]
MSKTLKFGLLQIKSPAIVASLSGDALSKAQKAEKLGADLVEVRLDLISSDQIQVMKNVRKSTHIPLIATNRMRQEGGQFDGSEEDRIDLLCEASRWADLVDIELLAEGRDQLMENVKKPVIVSYHDFKKMSSLTKLRSLRDEIFKTGADIAKIAVTPTNLEEDLKLLSFLLETEKPICVIGMGEISRHLRAVAPIYGSVFAYGYIEGETAPGQMSVDSLNHVLRRLMA